MITFVLECPSQEALCRQPVMVPLPVLEMDGDLGSPFDLPLIIRYTEAAFRIHCFSHRIRQHRIHEFPDACTVPSMTTSRLLRPI